MTVLSIDLARRRYSDFGIAQIEPGSSRPTFPKPKALGLVGEPEAASCARAIAAYANLHKISVLLLDGPQGWRHPDSPIEHMRLAERVLNTPGKTGNPGQVKPKTYLDFFTFSIDVFTVLHQDYSWALLEEDWAKRRRVHWVLESFPAAAWVLLGLDRLPGKSRTRVSDLARYTHLLKEATGYNLPERLTHDQLQAAVVLPAGEAVARRDPNRVILAGYDPLPGPGDVICEGWIVNPCHAKD